MPLAQFRIVQQPRDPSQRTQVIRTGFLGRQQDEDQVDALAIHRFEIGRAV